MLIAPRPPPRTLQRDDIIRRIPHQGSMCLLNSVSGWDSRQIRCEALSHRSGTNPLRTHGRLGAACGIEYAAQAMAVHGALMAESEGHADPDLATPRAGYLASIRNVALQVQRLDDLREDLIVVAERESGDSSSILYSFSLHAGTTLLLSGRAIVILDAAAVMPTTPLTSDPENSPREKP